MVGKREKPEEILSKLRKFEVLQGQGAKIAWPRCGTQGDGLDRAQRKARHDSQRSSH